VPKVPFLLDVITHANLIYIYIYVLIDNNFMVLSFAFTLGLEINVTSGSHTGNKEN